MREGGMHMEQKRERERERESASRYRGNEGTPAAWKWSKREEERERVGMRGKEGRSAASCRTPGYSENKRDIWVKRETGEREGEAVKNPKR
jgi:hypothetical protein